jgi:hypothetical protein
MAQYSACHSSSSSSAVHGMSGTARLSMVAEKIRQAMTLYSGKHRCSRSAVSNWRASMRQPLFKILCQTSIYQT